MHSASIQIVLLLSERRILINASKRFWLTPKFLPLHSMVRHLVASPQVYDKASYRRLSTRVLSSCSRTPKISIGSKVHLICLSRVPGSMTRTRVKPGSSSVYMSVGSGVEIFAGLSPDWDSDLGIEDVCFSQQLFAHIGYAGDSRQRSCDTSEPPDSYPGSSSSPSPLSSLTSRRGTNVRASCFPNRSNTGSLP
jgi:hypothetical protein